MRLFQAAAVLAFSGISSASGAQEVKTVTAYKDCAGQTWSTWPSNLATGVASAPYSVATNLNAASQSSGSILPEEFANPKDALVLKPSVHWDCDTSSLDNAIPSPPHVGSKLFFTEPGASSAKPFMSGFATYNFTAPSVAVDHCDYLTVTYDGNGNMVVKFGSKASFDVAVSSWKESGLYLVGHIKNCGKYDEGELCYFLVTALRWDSSSLTCYVTGVDTSLANAITNWMFEWGIFKPTVATNVTASNSASNSTSSTVTACVPPKDTKYGLPTACLGSDFDKDLDNEFGYEDWDTNGWASSMADFSSTLSMDESLTFYTTSSGDILERRNAFTDKFANGFRVVVQTTKSVVGKTIDTTKTVVKTTAGATAKGLSAVGINIPGVNKPIDGSTPAYSTLFKLPKAGYQFAEHKTWRNAIKVFSYKPNEKELTKIREKNYLVKGKEITTTVGLTAEMKVTGYCVDCSLTGTVVAQGYAKGAILTGFTATALDIKANLAAVVQFGIEGSFELTLPKVEMKLYEQGVTGILQIPGAITVGPYADVSLEVVPKVTLEGTVFAGALLTWKDAKAHLAWGGDGQSSASGWTPEIKPVFNASAEVSLALDFGMPIGVNVGISIMNGKWERKFGIEERPSIEAKASIAGSVALADSKSTSKTVTTKFGTEECGGVKTSISFKNGVSAFYLDAQKKKVKVWEPKALQYEKDLWEGCFLDKTKKTRSIGSHSHTHSNVHSAKFYPRANSTSNATEIVGADWTLNITNVVNDTDVFVKYSGDGVIAPYELSAYNTTKGYQYTTLIDEDKITMMVSCADGNIYAQLNSNSTLLDGSGCGSLWPMEVNQTEGAIFADGSGNLLHYYTNTMEVLGVSRLRNSDSQSIPVNSSYITFMELADDSSEDTWSYYPVDPYFDIVYDLVMCSYEDQAPRVFVVLDITEGISILESPDVTYSITGGTIVACYPYNLIAGSEVADQAWSGEGGDLEWADDWIDEYDYEWDWEDDDTFIDNSDEGDVEVDSS